MNCLSFLRFSTLETFYKWVRTKERVAAQDGNLDFGFGPQPVFIVTGLIYEFRYQGCTTDVSQSRRYNASSCCGWRRQPLHMEDSCEYTKWAVADSSKFGVRREAKHKKSWYGMLHGVSDLEKDHLKRFMHGKMKTSFGAGNVKCLLEASLKTVSRGLAEYRSLISRDSIWRS